MPPHTPSFLCTLGPGSSHTGFSRFFRYASSVPTCLVPRVPLYLEGPFPDGQNVPPLRSQRRRPLPRRQSLASRCAGVRARDPFVPHSRLPVFAGGARGTTRRCGSVSCVCASPPLPRVGQEPPLTRSPTTLLTPGESPFKARQAKQASENAPDLQNMHKYRGGKEAS